MSIVDFIQPNMAICTNSAEEFADLCYALAAEGFHMRGTKQSPDPEQYCVDLDDEDYCQDSVYITRDLDIQYTSRRFSLHYDDDHPLVVDFSDLSKKITGAEMQAITTLDGLL